MSDVLDRLKAVRADRYALEREIGAGGMAKVYLAQDLRHHRKVALKVPKPELAAVVGADRSDDWAAEIPGRDDRVLEGARLPGQLMP